MDTRIQILAIIATGVLFIVVLELVRRRRLQERYALLWLASAVFLLVLAAWRDLLAKVADLVGIAYPPNALFFLAFAAILVVLLHFSVVISRLSDQTKILAQRTAMLDERLRRQEAPTADDVEEDEDRLSEPLAGSRFTSR
jgi:hypothetical protein